MNIFKENIAADPSLHFLQGEGEMRKRIREFDWSKTELGEPSSWPDSLKSAVAIMLDCGGPAYIAWGPHCIQMYNDAYISALGKRKHPEALGIKTSETWAEIWDFIEPLFTSVKETGRPVAMANKIMLMQRHDYLEESYFNFSYNPLADETGQVRGVLVLCWETTAEFVSYRRANVMRMLAQGLSDATNMHDIRIAFENTVLDNPRDLPFGLWYEIREDRSGLDLVAAAGIRKGSPLCPEFIDLKPGGFYTGLLDMASPVARSCAFAPILIHWERGTIPDINPQVMIIKPFCYSSYQRPDGYLILAVNPLRPNDAVQQDFLQMVRLHLENAVRRVRQFELERREQAHQFHTVMSALPCLVWMSDASMTCNFVSDTWREFTGYRLEQVDQRCWKEVFHPDDAGELERYRNAFAQRETVTLEYRLRHFSGEYRWMLDKAMPRYGIHGEFVGYIGTCIDITDRKLSEQKILSSQAELRTLYESLETAREEERYALAREVHDQLGQILSAAKIDIKLLEEELKAADAPFSPQAVATELRSASSTIEQAIQVVRRLATELRPPELESQGLSVAIQWHASDFERRTRIRCHLSLEADMPHLNESTATTLFRIFQEAMTNILRHANASQAWISLGCRGNRVQLRVRDNGIGIGAKYRRSNRSIGLKGMRERAAIAGGRLVVGSVQPSGTLVSVNVPLVEESGGDAFGMAPLLHVGDTP
ncbi:PAS domain S-box-containing protein [Paucimonas lemoignei]|uniref:PAS domain S-box-containing protein n=1 Tax=Paucimonas lemoignei TaxID=29443 RepID=A0A4V2UJ29_PAULE|nr:PAS domain-containing protein [Paucimonas lemoignei]TCS38450.1 PAS domain S-box-containing protein [Paucimonas lemoignei]